MAHGNSSLEARINPEAFYSELTDPQTHNPSHFCYIVHALNPAAKNGLLLTAIRENGYDPRQEINLLREPERIAEKLLISSSIINQDHTATWGKTFFILNVPWSNFVSMSPRDSATRITNPSFVLEYARSPYTTPLGLIAETRHVEGNSSHNEVVVTGNKGGKLVEIVGVGIKYTDVGTAELREPAEAERMREIARQMHIPLIELTSKSRIKDSEADVNYGCPKDGQRPVKSIYVDHGGRRYCFEASWDNPQLQNVMKSQPNFYGGNNPVTQEEYLAIRPTIRKGLSTETDLQFLKQIDEWFELKLPNEQYQS